MGVLGEGIIFGQANSFNSSSCRLLLLFIIFKEYSSHYCIIKTAYNVVTVFGEIIHYYYKNKIINLPFIYVIFNSS